MRETMTKGDNYERSSLVCYVFLFVIWFLILIENARTKRGSSHIRCKPRKMAKTLCPCVYFTHSCCVFKCLLHNEHLFTMKLTQMVKIGAL